MQKHLLCASILSLGVLVAACDTEQQAAIDVLTAQDDAASSAMTEETQGYVMEDGKMMKRDGDAEMPMEADATLPDGSMVMMNGTVKKADGTVVMMNNGDMIMTNGSMTTEAEALAKTEEDAAGLDGDGAMEGENAYIDQTQANIPASVLTDGETKVLFFHASWCPSCKKANGELTQWYGSEEADGALTMYKINYDTEKDLKAKYGVTYQHTFVKVDGQGNMIEKIQSPNVADIETFVRP